MKLPKWHEEPLSKTHDRKSFDCGDVQINDFLLRYARQSHDFGASKTFCAIKDDTLGHILGFYTLTPSAVSHDDVPTSMTKGMARHEIGGFKLARIATSLAFAGHGLGGQLLAAAALRCLRLRAEGGGYLLIIDAKNERAAGWYTVYGAEPLRTRPLTLVIPLHTFAEQLTAKGLL